MRLARKLLVVVVSQSFQKVVKTAWKLDNTAPSVIVMGFHSFATVDVEDDALSEIPTVQGGQTTETLGTALVRHVAQTEIVVVVEIGALLPTESETLLFVAAPVLVSPPVVVKFVQSAPVVEYVMPHPWSRMHMLLLFVEYVTPTLNVAYVALVITRTVTSIVFPTSTAPITSVPIEVRCCIPSARSLTSLSRPRGRSLWSGRFRRR